MLRNLGLSASLAATAVQAVIIPSTMSVGGDDINAMTLAGVDPFKQMVKADCRGCLFAQRGEFLGTPAVVWTDGIENALLAKFSVSDDLHQLSFNDHIVYPTSKDAFFTGQRQQPEIIQVLREASMADINNATLLPDISSPPLEITGWGWSSQGKPTEDGKELLLTVRVNIQAVAGQKVDVPEITAQLLKNQNEELLLLRVDAEEPVSEDTVNKAEKPKEECHSSPLLCKWRNTIADTFSALRTKIHGMTSHSHKKPGCKGKGMAGHHKINGPGHKWHPHGPPAHAPHIGEDWGEEARKHHRPGGHNWDHQDGEFKHHGGHHHHGPPDGKHHHGHQHSGFGRVTHFFGDIAAHVIAPMLLGLVIGMLIVFVGWSLAVLASIIVAWRAGEAFSWDHYAPRWRSGYAVVDEDDEVVYVADEDFVDIEKLEDGTDEKAGLLAAQEEGEAPPVYVESEDKSGRN